MMKRSGTIWTSLFLAAFLTACGQVKPKPVDISPPPSAPKVIKRSPPAEYMLACGIPAIEGTTTEALVNAYILSVEALEECNARLAKLREWSEK